MATIDFKTIERDYAINTENEDLARELWNEFAPAFWNKHDLNDKNIIPYWDVDQVYFVENNYDISRVEGYEDLEQLFATEFEEAYSKLLAES